MISSIILSLGSFFSQYRPLDIFWGRLHYSLTLQGRFLKQNKSSWEEPPCSGHLSITNTLTQQNILLLGSRAAGGDGDRRINAYIVIVFLLKKKMLDAIFISKITAVDIQLAFSLILMLIFMFNIFFLRKLLKNNLKNLFHTVSIIQE